MNTDVYANFGRAFPDLIRDAAKSLVEVRGVGGSEEHSSLNLPDVELKIGPTLVTLRRAKMLTERVNSPHFVGNLGFDLLKQHGAFEIDLRAMRLELQTAEEANPKGSVQLSR